MSNTERTYDLLDVLRVIKGVWRWALLVPIFFALVVGTWSYFGAQKINLPTRSQTIVRFPAAAFDAGAIEQLGRSITRSAPASEATAVVLVDEIPSQFAPSYRTIKLTIDADPSVDAPALLKTAIERVVQSIEEFDAQNRRETQELAVRQDLLKGYLTGLSNHISSGLNFDERTAEANSVAAIVSALANLDLQDQQVRERGSGPVVVVSPIDTQSGGSSLRWIRFPIVAGIGALFAVLFVAFTQDGIRLAAARRRGQA